MIYRLWVTLNIILLFPFWFEESEFSFPGDNTTFSYTSHIGGNISRFLLCANKISLSCSGGLAALQLAWNSICPLATNLDDDLKNHRTMWKSSDNDDWWLAWARHSKISIMNLLYNKVWKDQHSGKISYLYLRGIQFQSWPENQWCKNVSWIFSLPLVKSQNSTFKWTATAPQFLTPPFMTTFPSHSMLYNFCSWNSVTE
jgi:hypothetical protein